MTEVRALLLTDVVDSTKLSETLGDAAMAALWAAHDRVARDLLVDHGGREIDKTDGFLFLFDEVGAAAEYALAYHRAIAELDPPIRARAGLHFAEVILTENRPEDVARGAKPLEVDGIAKPTAARVMSVATGGQTLVTPAARAALDARFQTASHGHWRMKGVAEPIELFEVGDADSPFQPPPDGAKVYRVVEKDGVWVPVREVPHSLPAERDAFVGREEDLRGLARLLGDGARLVSVLGIGGTGKTRLVTRFGWTWLGDFPGGVWFCDLSEARSPGGIALAVGRALGVQLGGDDVAGELGGAMAEQGQCLVLLDNFEQVAEHADATVGRWLDSAPEARFVVTTREVLGLPGETAFPLAPLPEDRAVALFEARAAQARRGFTLSDADRVEVEALVELLDRLPLAIELAAARARVMSPTKLRARMSERFRLLVSKGRRGDRHSTLQATLDWSWDLLLPDEQAALAQLSVFEGGFTLEAAEAVLELEELWAEDAVQSLVDKSLVRPVAQADGELRFDLLVSVQEYAAARLEAQGLREAEARHVACFARLVETEPVQETTRLLAELDNLFAACRRALRSGEAALAARTCQGLWRPLMGRGPFAPVLDLATRVLAMPTLAPQDRADVVYVAGGVHFMMGQVQPAVDRLEEALQGFRAVQDVEGVCRALTALGSAYRQQGRLDAATECYEQAGAICRERGDDGLLAYVTFGLGQVHYQRSRMAEARAAWERTLEASERSGGGSLAALATHCLGDACAMMGDIGRSKRYYERCIELHGALGSRHNVAHARMDLAKVYMDEGRTEVALSMVRESLEAFRSLGSGVSAATALGLVGLCLLDLGQSEEAQLALETASEEAGSLGDVGLQANIWFSLASCVARNGDLPRARSLFVKADRRARELDLPMVVHEGLCRRAQVLAAHDLEAAGAAAAEAEEMAGDHGFTPGSRMGRLLQRARAALERAEAGRSG